MPYDEEIDTRIKKIVSRWKNTDSKKMFGGVCYLLDGNMFCGVYKEYLILRIGKEEADISLGLPFAKPFDITGRPMKAWIMLDKNGFGADNELRSWLNQAKKFVKTLPSK